MGIKGALYQPIDLNAQEATTSSKGLNGDNHSTISDVTGLQVTFLSEYSGIKNVLLPWPAKGNYYLDSTDQLQLGKYIYIKEEEGKWVAYSTKPAFFRDPRDKVLYRAELTHGSIYGLQNAGGDYTVFSEFSNERSNVFHNYRIDRLADITIGRTPDNDIQYENPLVSRLHATLRWDKKEWVICDQHSTNGVFVNNKRVNKAVLMPGDCIFIVGLRINIGIGFVSINDENGRIAILSTKIRRISSANEIIAAETPGGNGHKNIIVNRLPRRRVAFEPQKISVENPPASLSMNGIPLFLRMGSSMVMGSTALMAGNVAMMLTTMFFPLLSNRYTDKQKKEYEEKRITEYNKYLETKKNEIRKEKEYEENVLNKNYPSLSTILGYTNDRKHLWERRNLDDDFLTLRIGYGRQPLVAEFDYQKKTFQVEEDPLLTAMYALVNTPVYLRNVPIMLSLVKDPVCGILGSRKSAMDFARSLIMQIAILHSFDEVKLIVISEDKDLETMEFVRYLPHLWNDQRDMRFLATSEAEAYQISEYLKKEIGEDLEKRTELQTILKKHPYYVIFAFSRRIFDGMEILKDVMQADRSVGISSIAVFEDLPKDCRKIIHLEANGSGRVQHINAIEKEDDYFKTDIIAEDHAKSSMQVLCNTNLKTVSLAYSLPKTLTFLEMFGVGKVEQLNISRRWKENNPVKSLSVPIGVGTDGELFCFDIHEKVHGPHGLVAGMTGSGKSEFIITYILSLAASFSPDEVSFVLIDYKGGGLAGAFEDDTKGIHLPHVVGTITNLDGSSIQRSLLSIQSELMRRQRIFNDAKSSTSEGTMDIYTYQKLYRAGKVKEPLSHLLIVSDEFAELKKQEPDFMDQLISAARIGRSLGVHLILATQKPAGVVDDQIWSNTKFRICLRVQDRNDSYDMIRRPEAAELKDTGRFYLQVGYNEFFALGQSGYCGADYQPAEEVIVLPDDEIQIIDALGQPIGKRKPKKEKVSSESADVKQIVAIVQEITKIATREGFKRRPLWKEELPKHIGVKELAKQFDYVRDKNTIGSLLGIVDDPSRQNQFPLFIDLLHNRNLLIAGEAGSGKTTMFQTILYDVVEHYSPEEINFYILDFSSRNLSVFRSLPHCGGFVTDEDEDAIIRVFDLIKELINDRRTQFANAEVSSFDAYLEVEKIPLILLVIDNVARFEEFEHGRDLYDVLGNIMNTGVGYGIKTLISISQINDCPMRLRRESGQKIALRARDRYVYSDILDCRCRYEPADTPGRGICVVESECYEFQTALSIDLLGERERSSLIKKHLCELASQYKKAKPAKRIKVQDENMSFEEFADEFMLERIPIGIQMGTLKSVAMPLQQLNCVSLYFGNERGISLIMGNLLYAMRREHSEIIILKRIENSVFNSKDERLAKYIKDVTLFECTDDGLKNTLLYIENAIARNKVFRNQYCDENGIGDWKNKEARKEWRKTVRKNTNPSMIIFESVSDFCITASTETAGTLSGYLQMCEGHNIYFWGAYYPDDEESIKKARFPEGIPEKDYEEGSADSIREKRIRYNVEGMENSFNKDKFVIMAGGKFDKQKSIVLSPPWSEVTNKCSPQNDNKLLLNYHGNITSLYMPCGGANEQQYDPDEQEII